MGLGVSELGGSASWLAALYDMRLQLLNKDDNAHEDAVWSAVWVPESNKLLTGSADETVKCWEEADTKLQCASTHTGHTLGVVWLTCDQAGTYAAAASLDSIIRVWNVEDGAVKASIEAPPSETWGIAFAPASDKLRLAAAGGSSHKVLVYNVDEPEEAATQLALPVADEKQRRDKFVLSIAYSPDGKRIACGTTGGSVVVFDVESSKVLHKLEGHYKPVRDLTFTPDSKMILTACNDMHSNLYDVANGKLIESFSGHESWVLSVSCHPGGNAFVTSGSDSKIKLWDLNSRACVQTAAEHGDQVWCVAFRGDGGRLGSVSDDKSVALWDFV